MTEQYSEFWSEAFKAAQSGVKMFRMGRLVPDARLRRLIEQLRDLRCMDYTARVAKRPRRHTPRRINGRLQPRRRS